MKQSDLGVVLCTKCDTPLAYSEVFVNDILKNPREFIKGSENLKTAHILCTDCFEDLNP